MLLHGESQPGLEEQRGLLVRQGVGPGRSRRLHVELLQHLHRQRQVGRVEQAARGLGLGGLGGVPAHRVQEDVGVNEAHARAPCRG